MTSPSPQISKVLVTGAAGFIGFHLARRLLRDGMAVYGIDNLNAYYDPQLKQDRLAILQSFDKFNFLKLDLNNKDGLHGLFAEYRPDAVVNLAAQAGVRHSIDHPEEFIASNIDGFLNVLECCRTHPVQHLVYASSSSVYGGNTKVPFAEEDAVDHPVSLYAATKKSNELMAHTYAHLYNIPATGLRFFTVYGPWGRPDMAVFKFTQSIYAGQPIDVYNHGDMSRDFTYIDDIVEGIVRVMMKPATPDPKWGTKSPTPGRSFAPHYLYNIGHNEPVPLMEMIETLESEIGLKAQKNMLPMQPGDVKTTYADITALQRATGFSPSTPLDKGLAAFVTWYRDYYKVGNGPAERAVAGGQR